MKIFIAGCGGMLGEAFHNHFKDLDKLKCTDIDLNEEWLSYCDIKDYDAYRQSVLSYQPDALFHLGALTDLEYCEIHVEESYLTNTIAVENAVFIANELDIPLLYISTAGIFDGEKESYDDWDTPHPLGHYARSKYAGEVFVKENTKRYLICRAGWMMGAGPKKDKKFVQKLMRQIKGGKKEIHVVNDKLGTPTYTHDFANNVDVLFRNKYWGLYNMVCDGDTSRLEVARELLRIIGLQNEIELIEVESAYFKDEYFAPRPACERLLNRKLKLRGLNTMRDWRIALKEYLSSYYKNYL